MRTTRRINGPAPAVIILKSRAMPLEDLLQQYAQKRLRGKSIGTETQFVIAISHFSSCLGHIATVDDLTDDAVNDLQHWLVEVRGITTVTAVSYAKKILALWRFGARQRIVEKWPEVELMKFPTRDPIAWTEEEVKTIMRALRAQEGSIGDVPARHYWPALFLMFYDSAERLGAVLSLAVADLNLKGAWATFRAEFRKGKLRDRGMPLHPDTVEALRLVIEGRPKRKYVFEAPFGVGALLNRYRTILRDAGLPHDRKRLFHCIRRTVASHFESNGHDATELLDHSTRKVTTDSYLSPQIVRRARPASVLSRPESADDREQAEAAGKAREAAEATRFAELRTRLGNSLAGWVDAYADARPEQADDTAAKRRGYVKSLAKFLEREPTLDDVTITTLMRYALWRIEQGAAESTAENERLMLLAVRRFAEGGAR